MINPINIPVSYNYISAFLTFQCNLHCSYCINKYNGLYKYTQMSVDDWVQGLNRIKARSDLPITLTGGEPTLHSGFYQIVSMVKKPMDLLSNGMFNIIEFVVNVPTKSFKRNTKYSSIRFSYHSKQSKLFELFYKVVELQRFGYEVGVWAVGRTLKNYLLKIVAFFFDIDFRIKPLLEGKSKVYKYPEGLDGVAKKCLCKPSELLIAPDGRLFRCHHDLYHGVNSYGHILDKDIVLPNKFLPCDNFGKCNPCDLKLKYNRFQETGHCAMEIKVG